MGQALYRQYRSKNLAEIVGQEHITRTLGNALEKGKVGHAYLLTGPRGVGKTSIARILAHEINELPYDKEQVHLDIIEIDAASNRRIDEIRDLRDKVHVAPTSAQYKVYIIDEVHMLTKEAFNALLKTLEEPPAHVIFILATTDVHKLPDTIISRTQHFTFKPIPLLKVVEHLKTITKTEKITIDDGALELIAAHGGGSFRDSIGLLEQARGLGDSVTEDLVRDMLGVPPETLIDQLYDSVASNDMKQVIELMKQLLTQGYLAEEISSQLSAKIRNMIIVGQGTSEAAALLKDLLDVPVSREPATMLEITLLSHMQPATVALEPKSPATNHNKPKTESREPKSEPKPAPVKETAKVESSPKVSKFESEPAATKETVQSKPDKESSSQGPASPPTKGTSIVDESVWEAVLSRLKKTHSTLYSVGRMATFDSDGQNITLTFGFAFHKKRMESTKHKTIITDLIHEIAGTKPVITCLVVEKKEEKPVKILKPEPKSDHLSDISNIFGGAEVLES